MARKVNVTAATISHHTSALRDAGLVHTHRHGTTATHRITPLGYRLLGANP